MTTGDTVWNISWPNTSDGTSFYQEHIGSYDEVPIFNDPNLVEERRDYMNLRETVTALEARNVSVAIDLGVHSNCAIDSNCPKAIELRRIIVDAGITLAELIEAYSEGVEEVPDIVDYARQMPEISAMAHINIAGKDIEVDLKDMVSGQVQGILENKLYDIGQLEQRIRNLGASLYNTYRGQVNYLKNNRSLPQLSFPFEELTRYKCLITSLGESYFFLFQTKYAPEYVVDEGIRSELSQEDKDIIRRDPAYICFEINVANRIRHITLRNSIGTKLRHYHGSNSEDCWGNLTVPTGWDGTLSQLYRVTREYSASLTTINRNSLMSSYPDGMPDINDIITRATVLGREGEVSVRAAPPDEDYEELGTFSIADDGGTTPRRTGGWGRQAREEG